MEEALPDAGWVGPMSRFARKIDSSQRGVVAAFSALGCTLLSIQSSTAGCPDLAVGFAGVTHLIEVKPDTKLKAHMPTDAQQRFATSWRGGDVPVVRSAADVELLVEMWRHAQLIEHKAAAALVAQPGVTP